MKRALVALLILGALNPVAANDWKTAQPDYAWSFPRDHWAHEGYKTEWWYFTGHLQAEDGRRFGYQFTFFRVGVLPTAPDADSAWTARDLIMGHAAVSDLDRNDHRFSEVIYRAIPLLGGFGAWSQRASEASLPLIAWSRAPAGTPGKWRLAWNGSGFDFDMRDDAQALSFSLSTRPGKALVFQGPNGFSRKTQSGSGASLYYSFTRLQTSGQLSLDGQTWQVTGESWMDKEFFTSVLAPHQLGWDWFSLQLDDRREVMLFLLRREDGTTDFASGTVVHPDGSTTYLDGSTFTVVSQARWQSPHTEGVYPSRWRLTIPREQLDLEIVVEMADQENRSGLIGALHYWEGAVKLLQDGLPAGKGYVELTGYGTSSRPAL